jgi:hypothetical protein
VRFRRERLSGGEVCRVAVGDTDNGSAVNACERAEKGSAGDTATTEDPKSK